MEVSGKKQYLPENKLHVPDCLICKQCSSEGEDIEADGFCQNCQEYLCRTCIKYHRKTTLTKHHTILDKDNMPKNVVSQTVKQICTEPCTKHTLEVIKFFCRDHDMVGCGNCMVIDHKVCKVEFIPDIADDFVSGLEYNLLLTKLEELQSEIKAMKETTGKGKQTNFEMYSVAVDEIRKLRKEIDGYLDRMERYMIAECDRMKKENEQMLTKKEDVIDLLKSELDKIQQHLISQSKESTDLFVQAKQTSVRLNDLVQAIERERNCTLNQFEFQRNTYLDSIILENSPLGTFIKQTSQLYLAKGGRRIIDFDPKFKDKINVKSASDKSGVLISNMISTNSGILLCVDRKNKSVKVVDTGKSCLCSQIYLKSGPWDITSVESELVAVTVPDDRKVQFLSLKDQKLSFNREIEVDGRCRGIGYNQNTLVVSFVEPPKLETLTVDGKVIRTITTSPNYSYVLGWPGCLDVCVHGSYFLVSDLHKNCVFKISFDGKLLAIYRDETLKEPRAVSVCEDGSFLVCSSGNGTVHLVSPECRKIKTLLAITETLKSAESVCYSDTTSTLYLSNCNTFSGDMSNHILVYHQASF